MGDKYKQKARALFLKENKREAQDEDAFSPDYQELVQNANLLRAKDASKGARDHREKTAKAAWEKKDKSFRDKEDRIKRSIMWKALLKRG